MSRANVYALMSGLKSFVAANLPRYLGEVGTEIGVRIAEPADHVLGYRETLASERYPVLCYVAADANPEPSGQGAQWLPLSADIVAAYKHSVPATLEKALLGYADALVNLVGENESLGGACELAEIQYLDFYHGAPGAKDIGVVVVTVIMRSELRT